MDNFQRGAGLTSQRMREALAKELRDAGIRNPEVLAAMREVPRHLFVDEALAGRAYENTALPIGYGQTISQPFTVARMLEYLLRDNPNPSRILEVGTGCGYQTALLAKIARHVFTVERVDALLRRARARLQQMGVSNFSGKYGDGGRGWLLNAPYDAIIVSAAAKEVPQALLRQLGDPGRLVMPLEEENNGQRLVAMTRHASGYHREKLECVFFVPMLPGAA